MLSQSSEYALRAVALLASREDAPPSHAKELARTLGVPANYLSKILHQLALAGVLASRRGRQGGFALLTPASRLRLVTVVEPFEDLGQYRSCLLGRTVCGARNPCRAHALWQPVASAALTFLTQTTVEQLASSNEVSRFTKKMRRR